jgi:heme-degrading monooxygenase HmoA
VLRFTCFLGFWLAFAGMADCINRYFALERAAALYAGAPGGENVVQAYEDVIGPGPRGQFALGILRSQNEAVRTSRGETVALLRTFQETSRLQALFFAFMLMIFGLVLVRLGRSRAAGANARQGPRRIARHWRGLAKAAEGDRYIEHLQRDTLPRLTAMDGFEDAAVHRRYVKDGIEFVVITQWKSIDAIRQFAGREPETAVVPDAVRGMMVEYDDVARHYDVVDVGDTVTPAAAPKSGPKG